jgi:P27 family predicted phage terminase small subunit
MQPTGLTQMQKTAWRTIVADLETGGILDHADAGLIEAAAVFWGRAREARATVNKEGLIARSVRGYTAHPLLAVERESWAQFRMIAEQLGLGPVARARLGLAGKGKSMEEEIQNNIGPSARLRVVGGAQ